MSKDVEWTYIRLEHELYALAQWTGGQRAWRLSGDKWAKSDNVMDVSFNGAIVFGQTQEGLPPLPTP